jgi:hypothetical protein
MGYVRTPQEKQENINRQLSKVESMLESRRCFVSEAHRSGKIVLSFEVMEA